MREIDEIRSILQTYSIKSVPLFWDEQAYGKSPDRYAVYYGTGEESALSSDDAQEAERLDITVSIFVRGEYRELKQALRREFARSKHCTIGSQSFEVYEKETKYNHFDFDLSFYKESEETEACQ